MSAKERIDGLVGAIVNLINSKPSSPSRTEIEALVVLYWPIVLNAKGEAELADNVVAQAGGSMQPPGWVVPADSGLVFCLAGGDIKPGALVIYDGDEVVEWSAPNDVTDWTSDPTTGHATQEQLAAAADEIAACEARIADGNHLVIESHGDGISEHDLAAVVTKYILAEMDGMEKDRVELERHKARVAEAMGLAEEPAQEMDAVEKTNAEHERHKTRVAEAMGWLRPIDCDTRNIPHMWLGGDDRCVRCGGSLAAFTAKSKT